MGLAARIAGAINVLTGRITEAQRQFPRREEERGFRRVSDRGDKALTLLDFQKQAKIAHFLWQRNGWGRRIIEFGTDFVVLDGFSFRAKDKTVESVLEAFWKDADNAWDRRQFERIQDLGIFGAMVFRAFVNEKNGHVKISPIDPSTIKKITIDEKNPIKITSIEVGEKTLEMIHVDDDPQSKTFNRLIGEAFYFGINTNSFDPKGNSDLITVADAIDAVDNIMFDVLTRIKLMNLFIWDIELEGASKEQCMDFRDELISDPPKPNDFRVHDEKEKWKELAPSLQSVEIDQIVRTVKLYILASLGYPEFAFGFGGDANRATSKEMSKIFLAKFKRRQAQIRFMFEHMFQYVIDQALIHGTINAEKVEKGEISLEFEVIVPEISPEDAAIKVDIIQGVVDSMTAALESGLIELDKARKIFNKFATDLTGMDFEENPEVSGGGSKSEGRVKGKDYWDLWKRINSRKQDSAQKSEEPSKG